MNLHEPLLAMARVRPPAELVRAPVPEFVTTTGEWCWERFEAFLPANALLLVAALSRGVMHNVRPVWNAIWKAPVAQRVRHYLWLAYRDRLLTNVERVRRHMAENAACINCGVPESTTHVLRDCEMARRIWVELVSRDYWPVFFSQDVCLWLWNFPERHPVTTSFPACPRALPHDHPAIKMVSTDMSDATTTYSEFDRPESSSSSSLQSLGTHPSTLIQTAPNRSALQLQDEVDGDIPWEDLTPIIDNSALSLTHKFVTGVVSTKKTEPRKRSRVGQANASSSRMIPTLVPSSVGDILKNIIPSSRKRKVASETGGSSKKTAASERAHATIE
ncbi:Ribonuclease H-like superfamily protein [Striga hermonthica]|uniref:Ribonuclease H-like superfamily protein n=1 Tax=Striga hermonthica TaxID=68872 RepID=A0A9N7NQ23_STRHE|nr:Ribonuclease H-like superfamily protein [Striga hermonthica]